LELAVPTTFGARDDIYGEKLGSASFGNQYLSDLITRERKGSALTELERAVMSDADLKAFVLKYSTNSAGFFKDVAEAYTRLTLLGSAYTTRNS
jgi:hypothetical protein